MVKELKPGNWVRHYGTRMWGEVLEIVPQRDNTLEIKVQREKPLGTYDDNSPTWWASYHVDMATEKPPTDADRRVPRPWRPMGGLW